MSPWFILCCSIGAFYMSFTSPRYNTAFGILCGILVRQGFILLGLSQ